MHLDSSAWKDNILLLAGGGVEMVIGLQALLGERSFLEIVWSRAGDTRSPNNILGFDGINRHGHRLGQDPIENNGMGYGYGFTGRRDPYAFFFQSCGTCIYLEIRYRSNFQKCDSLVGYIFEFAHHSSFPGSMLKSSNIWRVLEFGSFRGAFLYYLFLETGMIHRTCFT